jgi:hypothetical protein
VVSAKSRRSVNVRVRLVVPSIALKSSFTEHISLSGEYLLVSAKASRSTNVADRASAKETMEEAFRRHLTTGYTQVGGVLGEEDSLPQPKSAMEEAFARLHISRI